MYRARAVTQNDDGQYVEISAQFDLLRFDTLEEARNGFVPVFKAIAQVLDLVYTGEDDVWFEIFDTRWGSVSWEVRAKDCSTLTTIPF